MVNIKRLASPILKRDTKTKHLRYSMNGSPSSSPMKYKDGASSSWNPSFKEGSFGWLGKGSAIGSTLGRGFSDNAAARGMSSLGMAARLGVQSGAIGAGVGGTMEAIQGGSFWDGAKQGALNGAVGLGGMRALHRSTGAKSINPFAAKGQGSISNVGQMWKSMNKDQSIAKPAQALLGQRQRSVLASQTHGLQT